MERRCGNCCRWKRDISKYTEFVHPTDGSTFEQYSDERIIELHGHLVGKCGSNKLKFYEYPDKGGACVVDGSEYMADLLTSEYFHCINWEPT